MGAEEDMIAGYLSFMAMFMALIVGIFAILAAQALRAEETSGRAEPVLATPVSRRAWLGSHLAISATTMIGLLAVAGAATGLGAALVSGEYGHLWDTMPTWPMCPRCWSCSGSPRCSTGWTPGWSR
jgi:ABC-2 type transport system permease protein